ncbi:MAG: SIMPL domain-containing protein [Candidatus Krumholzibacteriia bacterium]
MNARDGISIPAAVILAVGVALAGWWVGHGFAEGRRTDRYVTVKGLSEREVEADVALWPVSFSAAAEELALAQQGIEQSKRNVIEFLQEHGIPAEQVALQSLQVNDQLANPWRGDTPVQNRFIITQTLMVRSEDAQTVRRASQDIGQLVERGVILGSHMGPNTGPSYLFTRLNELKPTMLAEATANAREAAGQFAQDSESRLGAIRNANQGVFVIQARDRAPGTMEENQLYKTVRVVSTVEYFLKN